MKKSSLQIILIVAIVGIIVGILLIPTINAYWVEEMKVEMEICDTSQIIGYKETPEELKITILKNEEVEIKIKFETTIDCESRLDIIVIENKEIDLLSPTIRRREQDSGCLASGTLILVPEEMTEDYDVIFLSPGIDNYGMDKTMQELLKDWESVNIDKIIEKVRADTANFPGSGDLMTVRKIKVETEEPKINIEWTIRNDRLEIYGMTNLPEDTIIEWRFIGTSIRTEGCTEVNWNRNIRFAINNVDTKEIKGNLILEKDGKFIAKETIIWPILTPTTEKFNELPISRSVSPKISESTPRPSPPPTTIKGIPETSETPGIELPFIFLAIATAAFLKRKKHFRDQ